MNGFFVTISNDLLEDKHFEKMGNAVWLYMWLIDKMTEISEGLGIISYGNPISINDVRANFPSLNERTYQRMIATLRDAGYINTVKAQYGLYVTVNKPKKIFGSKSSPDKNVVSKSQTRQNSRPDPTNLSPSPAKNVGSLYIDNNTNNNTLTNNSTDVELDAKAPVRYGKPEINELFDYWADKIGVPISARVQANRRAASTLQKKHGTEKVKRLIDGVAMSHNDRYAPRISDFSSLQQKMNELLVWGKTKQTVKNSGQGIKL